jgi:diacylglycerol O-acyltransferase / wax synthase
MNGQPIERLTPTDLINLYVETPSAPTRVGALAVLDGMTLLDSAGRLRIGDIRAVIDGRLDRVARLRQIIHRAGPLSGRPVWVDDPAFRIDRHVNQVALPAGQQLTDCAMGLVTGALDDAHPLWRIWFVTGLPDGQVALVFGMHHVVADGVTTVQLVSALMDPADGRDVDASRPWVAQRPPSWGALVWDNLRGKASGVRRLRPTGLAPWRMLAGAGNAPTTSLNHPVGARRRLAALTLDLAAVKEMAHRHRAKVNDVVLALAAGGVRDLLLGRSERVDGVRLHVSVAVSLRATGSQAGIGNRTGGIAVRLPLDPDPYRRLREIARESAEAKAHQLPTASNSLLVWLARLGLLRFFSRHQHMIHIVESNVIGPPGIIRLLGAPITSIVPIGTLVGNLSLGFLALSYSGQLTIAVQADANHYPDLPVLLTAMQREGRQMIAMPCTNLVQHPAAYHTRLITTTKKGSVAIRAPGTGSHRCR